MYLFFLMLLDCFIYALAWQKIVRNLNSVVKNMPTKSNLSGLVSNMGDLDFHGRGFRNVMGL